ncbi:LysR family transcriptional regulator [Cupriavidus sp. USMAA2-4]|uniref:LysR family transcriptional regulator n=1 Tax=Cupriavidus malaysiensis TaxID=367825 RepID=A0ABM6F2N0_9BURK|nr:MULTISPECIES: LysR family transcriptional regulator [Cupriavidus]AOY91214.1 LysR family transcriptional regulator [Cupriavidus sp. USMAA2-4]AOZ01207.1 LysR family transcriptional regulator [Cupriavidus sp. USMAHM13]AOZ05635.1 LysR family transcriptional regulator [Cupriavidus malaysiensis]
MDLRRIRHFVVLAETLNFRRAAERLHMAQPPLSVSIQKLEAELGTTLFTRDARGVALTPSGRAALAEARRMLFHAAQFSDAARSADSGTGGVLRVGFVGSTTFALLPRLVPIFRAEYPGVELVLREATSARILQWLDEEALDVGLVRTPLLRHSGATLLPLEHDGFVAALPRGNALAGKGPLRLAELAGERFIMYAADEAAGLHSAAMSACQLAGFVPRVAQEAIQVQTVLALVESGLGVALVPSIMQRFASERIVYRELEDYPAAAAIGLALAYRPDQQSAAAQRFRDVAARVFPLPRAGRAPAHGAAAA